MVRHRFSYAINVIILLVCVLIISSLAHTLKIQQTWRVKDDIAWVGDGQRLIQKQDVSSEVLSLFNEPNDAVTVIVLSACAARASGS